MIDRKARRKLLAIAGAGLTLVNHPVKADSVNIQRQPRLVAKSAVNGTATATDTGSITTVTGASGHYLVTHAEWVALAGSSSGVGGTFQVQVGCTNSGGNGLITGGTTNLTSSVGTFNQGMWPINCVSGNLTYHVILNSPTGSATVGYEWAVYLLQ